MRNDEFSIHGTSQLASTNAATSEAKPAFGLSPHWIAPSDMTLTDLSFPVELTRDQPDRKWVWRSKYRTLR